MGSQRRYKPTVTFKQAEEFPWCISMLSWKNYSSRNSSLTKYFVNNQTILDITSAIIRRKNRVTHIIILVFEEKIDKKKDKQSALYFKSASLIFVSNNKVLLYERCRWKKKNAKSSIFIPKGSRKLSLKRLCLNINWYTLCKTKMM